MAPPSTAPSEGFSPHHTLGYQPHYWSQRALQEDKRKCLTELPHTDHSVSNTLEFLHGDNKHHSCRAVAEKKKLHQPMRNENWRRRASTPTHPFATAFGEQKRFYSHSDLVEAKRKLVTTLVRPEPRGNNLSLGGTMSARERPREYQDDDDYGRMPNSARSPGSIAFSDLSRSQSVDGLVRRNRMNSDMESGARSPTMMELMKHHHSSKEEHPHNELATSWWQTCRENRDTTKPHRSHEKFSIKKQHHGIPIHEAPMASTSRTHYADSFAHGVGQSEVPSETSNRVLLYQRDPKGSAVQGQYPHCITNEAWAAPKDDETPPSRYHSCELMALDKRRHATPIDGGKRWQKMRVTTVKPGSPGDDNTGVLHNKCDRNLYQSQFMLSQHKRKHKAVMSAGGPSPGGTSPTVGGFDKGLVSASGGKASHRELQHAKRFNGVSLKPPQQLHADDTMDRPWPRPGEMLRDDASELSCATPPYPSAPPREVPQSAAQRAHAVQAITKYSLKSGARSDADSNPDLLHSSQQEIALRKACCSTSIRTNQSPRKGDGTNQSPRKGDGSTSRTSLNGTQLPSGNEAFKSQRQLEQQKMVHRFTHDHPRRQRAAEEPRPVQQAPTPFPRSGQWTPAHI